MISVVAKEVPEFWHIRKDFDAFMYNITCQIDQRYRRKNVLIVSSLWYNLLPAERRVTALDPNQYDIVFLISLFDWEEGKVLDEITKWHGKAPVRVGNTTAGYYLCFWALIANEYINYTAEQVAPRNFDYPFICYNRKVHEHRAALAECMFHRNLIEKGIVTLGDLSFNDKNRYPMVKQSLPLRIPAQFEEIEHDPLTGNDTGYNTVNDISSLGNIDIWNSHFLTVVTETTTHSDIFISEKIFKPMIGMRPFVVLGDTNVLAFLRSLGFQTFGHWFDESYDEIHFNQSPLEKINKICNVIECVANMTATERKQMYQEMHTVLQHNRDHLARFATRQRWKMFNDIFVRT